MTATTYQGLAIGNDPFALEPPDTYLAVGQTQVVETVNIVMAVYTKSTMAMVGTPRSLDALFGVPSGYSFDGPACLLRRGQSALVRIRIRIQLQVGQPGLRRSNADGRSHRPLVCVSGRLQHVATPF